MKSRLLGPLRSRFRNAQGAADAEPSKAEQVASDACTRSGLFGLALSLTLVALVPQWAEERAEVALGKYVLDRMHLRAALDELDSNPDWKRRVSVDPSLNKWTIAKLETFDISPEQASSGVPSRMTIFLKIDDPSQGTALKLPTVPVQAAASAAALVAASAPTILPNASVPSGIVPQALMAPTDFKITLLRNEFPDIARILRSLSDYTSLNLARKANAAYDIMIYRWQRRANLESTGHPATSEPEGLVRLSLEQVRAIAAYEYPRVDVESAKFSHGKRVDVAVGALPRNLFVAAVVLEGMLAFTLAYFTAFVLEATRCATFPSRGTMFAAFRRSRVTAGAFAVALLAPACASVAVAVASRDYILIGLAVAVVALTCWLLLRLFPYRRPAP